jgi:POT family proton-dependent oligopeptide transporter
MSAPVGEKENLDWGRSAQGQNFIVRFFASHPIGFWFFFWGEFAERSSYYGMRAILSLYMADKLGLGEENAGTYVSFFIAACYFLPLVGGFVADRWLGKYWTIVGFSIPYILGHVILGVESVWFMFVALCLLAMGSGVIKPNISTLMGLTYDQYRPGQTKLRSDGFAMFYFAINIGAAISQFSMPWLRTHYGYQVAFLFPAALMVLSFAIFAAGKRHYATEIIREQRRATPQERAERLAVLGRIIGLFVLVMFFWAIFDQAASTWIFFGNQYMDCRLFGMVVDPDAIQAFNAVFIVVLLPLVTLFWKFLDRAGFRVRPTDKMLGGFLLTATTMGVMAYAAWQTGPTETETRLVLKQGDASFNDAQLVFNHYIVQVQDGKVELKKDAVILKSQERLTSTLTPSTGSSTADDLKNLFAEGDVEFKEDGIHLNRGKIFLKEATISLPEGTATVDKGKVAAVTGELSLKDDGWLVTKGKDEPVLQKDHFTLLANKVSVWWQVLAYLVITVAEILISVTGLELAYTAAPKSMTGFVTALWLLTVGMANLFINASVTRLYKQMTPFSYFAMLAGTLLVVSFLFLLVARQFNRKIAAAAALTDVNAAVDLAKSEEE